MTKDRFHNANGDLSDYALHCGYIQHKETGPLKAELYHDGCYHVRAFKNGTRVYWEGFSKLGEARRHYASIRALVIATNV